MNDLELSNESMVNIHRTCHTHTHFSNTLLSLDLISQLHIFSSRDKTLHALAGWLAGFRSLLSTPVRRALGKATTLHDMYTDFRKLNACFVLVLLMRFMEFGIVMQFIMQNAFCLALKWVASVTVRFLFSFSVFIIKKFKQPQN